jgi:hypothetical protein
VARPQRSASDFLQFSKLDGRLERQPTWLGWIKDDLQMHTTWSDGSGSILDTAGAAKERNCEYIAVIEPLAPVPFLDDPLKIANSR